ncbi:MAG: glutamyl-tRNA reductase [candidate division Zixibacteria bacterium]|nr:glutamyl-tRNA reductase [candidate division Zixibacteria bacterium]
MKDITSNIATISVRIGRSGIGLLEALTISFERRSEKLSSLKSALPVDELVYIATCNRVEFVVVLKHGHNATAVRNGILDFCFGSGSQSTPIDFEPDHFSLRMGSDAVRHLFDVASSLDSVVVGEAQILGQVKDAYQFCRDAELAGPVLDRLFAAAFKTAKLVRTKTPIGEKPVSMASLVLVKLKDILAENHDAIVAMIGSGTMTEKLARGIRAKFDNPLLFVNRTPSRVEELGQKYSGSVESLERFIEGNYHPTVIISATSSPNAIFTCENLSGIIPSSGLLYAFDLAIPRDFHADIANLADVELWNVESLNRLSRSNRRERFKIVDQAGIIIEEQLKLFMKKEFSQMITPLMQSAAEESRDMALESLEQLFDTKLAHLSPADRELLKHWGNKAISRATFLPVKQLAEEIIDLDGGRSDSDSQGRRRSAIAVSQ